MLIKPYTSRLEDCLFDVEVTKNFIWKIFDWMKRAKMHELKFFENKAEQNFHKWTSESALSENHRFEFLKI